MVVVAAVIIIVTSFAARLLASASRRLGRRTRLRRELVELLSLIASILTWVVGLMIAAVVVFPNLTPTSILAGLGSVAIGFAFKDTFENVLAGILILFRREMRIGNFINTGDHEGVVDRITIRETHIRQTDGQLVIIPNATLFENPLRILTDIRRTTIVCGAAYGEDVDVSRDVIRRAVEGCASVDRDGIEIPFPYRTLTFKEPPALSRPVGARDERD